MASFVGPVIPKLAAGFPNTAAAVTRGDRKLILVAGYEWSGVQQWDLWNPRPWIRDPAQNIRYEAHHYWDPDHSGTYGASYASDVSDAAGRGP